MKKFASQVNSYALIITILLFGATFWLMKEKNVSSSLQNGLNSEKLRSEALLSEKLLVEKDVARLKAQLSDLTSKNGKMSTELNQTLQKLQVAESEFKKVKNENASMKQYRKQREELLALQAELEKRIEALTQGKSATEMENQRLAEQIAYLEDRNKLLTDDLRKVSLAAIDNIGINMLKSRERLTVRASKAKKLVAEFEIPGSMKNVSFKITDPSGRLLTNDDGAIASTVTANSNNYTASSTANAANTSTSKVDMVFIPKEKLKPGTYKVEILSENFHLGGLQVKLK